MKTIKILFTFSYLLAACLYGQSQSYQSVSVPIDLGHLRSELKAAPMEFSPAAKSSPKSIVLPWYDGSYGEFFVEESPMLDPDFAAQRPDLRTYSVRSVYDPAMTGRITLSDYGVNAFVLTPAGAVVIHPENMFLPFFHKISLGEESPEAGGCAAENGAPANGKKPAANSPGIAKSNQPNGANRRTFRFAVVGTGEFFLGNGGTVQTAQTAVVNSLNAIQAIYDRDLAIRFTVLTPFIYQDPNTDPFTQGIDRTTAAAEAVSANFAQNTYDIGEVFHNSTAGTPPGGNLEGGGVAALNSVCSNTPVGTGFLKAAGWSGSFSNVGAGWVNLAAHEIGHQFGAEHTFNGTGSNCTAAISNSAAYEIASGTTIMSYQGICEPSQNIPGGGAANHYFHAYSISQMLDHVNGGGNCAQITATGNIPPVVNANPCGGNYTIPKSTPFVLTGSGVDANGDAITYTWEQYNEDGAGTPTQGLIGAAAGANPNAPLFRSFPPSPSPTRYFPAQATVASGAGSEFEALPSVGRNLTFRLTGRDNNPNGGGMHCSDINVTVSATAGPFAVTAPNGGETWAAGGNVTVTWNNAGTTDFCNNVKISLSTDGGITYPFVLAASVANAAGTWTGQVPAGVTGTATARAKVECADNACVVFYDISNANFSITSGCQAASSAICPDAPVTLGQGSPGLNLGLNKGFGSVAASMNFNVTLASPTCNVAVRDVAGNGCEIIGNQIPFGVVQFSVDKTGTYTFTKNLQSTNWNLISLFQNAYDPAAPCPNFVSSTTQASGGGGIQGGWNITANLTECTTYFMVASGGFSPTAITGTVTFTGPGNVRVVAVAPPATYGYTYAAANAATGTIAAVNAQSDFTALAPGVYNVYGASYDANVNPANWAGQTIAGIYGSGACALFSANFKSVTVTGAGPCNIADAGLTDVQCNNNNTPNNPADDFFTFKLNPTGTNLSTNGYTVTGATVTPNSAAYGAATTFSRPAGTLGAGNAAITIQDNANQACQLALTVNSPAPVLTLVNTTAPATCNTNSGSAIIGGLANGQAYNISYKLNGTAANAGPLTADANGQVTMPNLGAGAYTEVFAVPAGAGCAGGPLAFDLANGGAPAFTVAGTNPTGCGGTDGSFTLSGLTAGTVYSLSYTANGNAVAPADLTADANGQITVGNLAAGNYTLINVSLNGCPGTPANVTLANAAAPAFTITSTNPTAQGVEDGSITIGMTAPNTLYEFTYTIDNWVTWSGSNFSDANGNLVFSDLGAGVYTDIIITLNGCASAPMTATLTNPPQNFFQDMDNDGFSDGTVVFDVVPPPNFKAAWELIDTLIDCNDLNPDEFPGQVWWQDLDGDGCGDGTFYIQCAQPPFCNAAHDMIVTTGDCNDLDPNNAPVNVQEICNGVDDDCDGEIDEDALPGTFFRDADGDGFGDPNISVVTCPEPAGYVANYLDCNDNDPNINPGLTDICNGIDDNCNGQVDDFGDTYVGNVSFTTQAEVDAFLPCWAKIQGNLTVQGSGISNLLALSNLQEVTGSVSIQYTALTDLEGLNSLHTVGGIFTIKVNNDGGKLRSLSGLENLQYVGRSLLVYYNFQLTDCCAIHELLNTPDAVGSQGGSASIFNNKTGCDSKNQVNEICEDDQSMALSGGATNPGDFAPEETFAAGQLVKIAPNPAADHVVVVFQTGFETGMLRLLDFSGRQLMESELQAGETGRSLQLSSWNDGVYILQVQMDGRLESQRLVISGKKD